MFQYGGPLPPNSASVASAQYMTSGVPTLPTRRVETPAPIYFNHGMFQCFGLILALLAAATLALGIADVVLTIQNYCTPAGSNGCSSSAEPYIWVWVASGIWGSIPIFFAGLFAMCIGRDPHSWTKVFALLVFLSAFVFAPAIVVLSGIEVWRGYASANSFYKYNGGVLVGTITPSSNPYQAKFAIPLVIAVLGGLMFIMTGIITLSLCCCMHCLGIYMPEEIAALKAGPGAPALSPQLASSTVINKQVYYPPRPQVKSANYQIANYTDGGYGAYPAYGRYGALPYSPAVRYSGGGAGGMFPYRSGGGGGASFPQQFMASNPSSFWN